MFVALALTGLVAGACGNSGDDDGDVAADGTTTTTTAAGGTDSATGDSDELVSISGVPGVSDEEISFAVLGTGAASSPIGGCQLTCYVAGIEAYFDYRNSEGGVHGRQLVVGEVLDDELMNNQVKALEVIQDGEAFGVFALPVLPSGFPDLGGSGMPVYAVTANAPESAGYDNIFNLSGASCLTCARPYYVHAASLAGASKVGALAYGVSQGAKDCSAGQVASFERWGGPLGMEVGYQNDDLAYGLPNGIAPEVTAMKDAGVDMVFMCTDANAVLTLEQELERQGMSDVVVFMQQSIGDPTIFERAGALIEGNISFTLSVPPFAPGDAAALYSEWIGKSDISPDEMAHTYAVQGWLNAATAYAGLAAAGADFDQASVVAATNGIEDFTADGLMPPMDWGRQHEPWTDDNPATNGPDPTCVIFGEATDGEWRLFAEDPAKPWSCWEAADLTGDELPEPAQLSFE